MDVPSSFEDRSICIVGLGYVGLTLAIAMAEVGFKVHGVEREQSIRDCLSEGRAHFIEAGLNDRLWPQISSGGILVHSTLQEVPPVSVYIITIGTPLIANSHKSNIEPIKIVAHGIASRLEHGALVVLRSTVQSGVTRKVVMSALDATGRKYDLAFCPERTLEGNALNELRTLPQIVGGINERSTERASRLFEFLTPEIIKVSSAEAAELIKLVNNSHRDLMFAFANEIADACDTLGVSASEVIGAANEKYPRSNMPLPMPGPVGGPCLEKDTYIFAESVAQSGGELRLAVAGRQLNEALPKRTVERIVAIIAAGHTSPKVQKISIIGLAFKGRPETSDLRGTPAIPLIAVLRTAFAEAELWGYDPAVPAADATLLGIKVAESAERAFDGATIVVFQNNNRSFQHFDLKRLSSRMTSGGVIYDFWSQFGSKGIDLAGDILYCSLGNLVHAKVRSRNPSE